MDAQETSSALTPATFLRALADKLRALDNSMVYHIRGYLKQKRSVGKTYNGCIYVIFADPNGGNEEIETRIDLKMIESLGWGREVVLSGKVHYKIGRHGTVEPVFCAEKIEQIGELCALQKEQLQKYWEPVISGPKRDLTPIFHAEHPLIHVVTGNTSVAVDDIKSAMGTWTSKIDLRIERVSLDNAAQVAEAIGKGADAHLVLLTRGGGQEVHDLDRQEILEAIHNVPTFTAVALGHSTDDLVLNGVVDRSFLTPTDFGQWLKTGLERRFVIEPQIKASRARLRFWRILCFCIAALAVALFIAWIF